MNFRKITEQQNGNKLNIMSRKLNFDSDGGLGLDDSLVWPDNVVIRIRGFHLYHAQQAMLLP